MGTRECGQHVRGHRRIVGMLFLVFLLSIMYTADVKADTVESIQFQKYGKTLTITKGETKKLKLSITPYGAQKASVKWSSSNSNIVSVTKNGKIRGLKKGTAKITAKAMDGSKKKVKLTVTVGKKVKKITIKNVSKNATLVVGEKLTLKAGVSPKKASNGKVIWSSSNETVATVDSKGKVTAVAPGTVEIKAEAADGSGVKAVAKLNIISDVKSVKIVPKGKSIYWTATSGSEIMVKANTSISLDTVLTRTSGSKQGKVTVEWSSSNIRLAEVSEKGVVKVKGTGVVYIRAKAQDKTASITITIRSLNTSDCGFVAHRGRLDLAPENSLSAVRLALSGEYQSTEIDIWKTIDDEFVLLHDGQLERMCKVSKHVSDMSLAEATSYRIVSGSGIKDYPNEFIPSLDQVLRILSTYPGKNLRIEIKQELSEDMLIKLLQKIEQYGLEEQVTLITFYENNIVNIRKLKEYGGDTIPMEYLTTNPDYAITHVCIPYEAGLNALYTKISAEHVSQIHNYGLKVNVWTVTDFATAYRMVKTLKVDYITTDNQFF